MSLYVVLLVIIVALIIIIILNQRYNNSKIETEEYARKQLIKKNKTLSNENEELRNQMLSSNQDVGHHAYKNAKRDLRHILDQYIEDGKLKYYEIVETSNLAIKHTLFDFARSFDFIIISDIGLINVDVKSWGEKTFYHFDVPDEHATDTNSNDVEKIAGHYISEAYHNQFNSPNSAVYTFTETVQPNRVVYDFYDYDPYQLAANNAKLLKDQLEQQLNFKIQSTGVIYFSDGTVNIIQGSQERDKYVDTVSTKSSLSSIINDAIELSKHPLDEQQVKNISNIFK
ncbi:hypothetical protein J3T65_09570 [Staphylococcus simiae]|uniref:hypothetical protein n=1 Tax=Staphylococcus simiae TaxID=308354 RepID=UPI001A961172|nr:hypothetical protein [Staphylococcus simiae]MBO1199644.1 hypothetical protein [Staphylococcus simiae]MBO1201919.1 hypothetical protein [Staphylococcus simiae]MBO1204134.1 hypothetical protein [Staphylococcus simiae]MBO1211638.1 hypothetical protein [Staphylococcus simiae]MBO1230368.1 hypothetical protein [Staphylococcus simiae]